MSWILTFVCIWAVVITARAQSDDGESRLVQIAQGPVRGYKDPEGGLFTFYNIPYATVTGRYMAPAAPPTWSEAFEAIDRGIMCSRGQDQDCLIANVFVPDTEQTNLPVMINIHGGGFQGGHGNSEQFKTFVRNSNIITVTFNYRVAILGFLCLGTENVPGNAAMKDQVALLRWVKQNIANFGGNSDDITISGCSVGSASVNLLTLSETTKGLFNKVISNSGASTGSFAVQTDPLENARSSARALNFTDIDDLDALEEFYLTAPLELLASRVFMNNENSEVTFGPCVEKDTGNEKFLGTAPYYLLKQGNYTRYPMMYGLTNMEGLNRIRQFFTWGERMNEKFSDFLPRDLQFESEEQREELAETVKRYYFGTQPVSNATVLSYIDYFTDVVFAYSMLFSTRLHNEAGNNTIYLYEYSFFDNNTSIIPGTEAERGADHCVQARAVRDEDETLITEEFRNMKRLMRDIWASFIKTGQPVPEGSSLPAWPPVGANRSPHLSLGRTIELRGPLLEDRARFWDDIYERHYRPPVAPGTPNSASTFKNVWLLYILIIYYLYSWK